MADELGTGSVACALSFRVATATVHANGQKNDGVCEAESETRQEQHDRRQQVRRANGGVVCDVLACAAGDGGDLVGSGGGVGVERGALLTRHWHDLQHAAR